MSTLPLDTHSDDRIESSLDSLNPLNTSAPNQISSFKTTGDVSEATAKDAVSIVKKSQYAPWEQTSSAMRSEEQTRTAIKGINSISTSPITYEDHIAPIKSRLLDALRQGYPHEILSSLLEAVEYPELFGSLSDTAFLQVFRLLNPKHFIDPYKRFHAAVSPKRASRIAGSEIEQLLAEYTSVYEQLIRKMFTHRKYLGFEKYEILLNLARVTGNRKLATATWRSMLYHGHKPDVVCYNYYFEALCWHDAPCPYDRCGLPRSSGGPFGVKSIVQRMFANMIHDGVMADAKTFSLLMTACSREGDLEGVKKILKRVWYVDVDAIMEDGDDFGHSDDFHPGSALNPTSDLLYTIVHIFGSNQNVTVALRVVDHISRRFSLPIDQRTWIEMFQWSYHLSVKPSKRLHLSGEVGERVPFWALEALLHTMVSTTKPSMQVLHLAIKMFFRRHMLDSMLKLMIAGLVLQRKSISIFRSSIATLNSTSRALVIPSRSTLQYAAELARLEMERDGYWIQIWLTLALVGKRWYIGPERIFAWQRRMIPKLVNLFWEWRRVWVYSMNTGTVALKNGPPVRQYWDLDLSEYLQK